MAEESLRSAPTPDDEGAAASTGVGSATEEDRREELQRLLEETSRTFALAIPLLPPVTERAVTTAYLLFRIADTFEDGHLWPRLRRVEALQELERLLDDPSSTRAREAGRAWARERPLEHDGYLSLLERTDLVVQEMCDLPPRHREVVRKHTVRTIRQMAGFVERTNEAGVLRLEDLEDLRAYCYAVAGIVGEMLTELFLLDSPTVADRAEELRGRAPLFGEALQLVNILRDARDDAREGRVYVPPSVDRATLFALARRDLEAAREYCSLLRDGGAHPGIVRFTVLPAELAVATLDVVEREGPGAKISRETVAGILARLG
jgi:farnesyl-diphosphate farnesyltransferase